MWVVGIDEAGYGPNLGPLVQAAVGLDLPDDDPAGWETMKAVVRRSHEKADGRLLIDDSKKVYTRGGLEALERGVGHALSWESGTFEALLSRLLLQNRQRIPRPHDLFPARRRHNHPQPVPHPRPIPQNLNLHNLAFSINLNPPTSPCCWPQIPFSQTAPSPGP